MNIFQNFAFIGKINAATKELEALEKSNSAVVDEIIDIINDLMKILDRIKNIAPAVGELIEALIALVKKILGKK